MRQPSPGRPQTTSHFSRRAWKLRCDGALLALRHVPRTSGLLPADSEGFEKGATRPPQRAGGGSFRPTAGVPPSFA